MKVRWKKSTNTIQAPIKTPFLFPIFLGVMMTEHNKHEVTQVYSGSWKEKARVENGKIKYDDPCDMSVEQFIDAECTCGEIFYDFFEMMEHLERYTDD